MKEEHVIIGAGLAGLTAAWALARRGQSVAVLEKSDCIGGASRTMVHEGFRFDLGGHRFYTKNAEVLDVVKNLLGDELLQVSRMSRIYLHGRMVNYPLSFFNALSALGPVTSLKVAASYAMERNFHSRRPCRTFEDWVVSRFGRQLYEIYFRPYSEKVWGVPCDKLSADFAAQRIKGLSFREAVKKMFLRSDHSPVTLVSQFFYPKLGFGRITEKLAEGLPTGAIRLRSNIEEITHRGDRVTGMLVAEGSNTSVRPCGTLISTMPITELVRRLSPPAPPNVLRAADQLRYRDMVIVFLMLNLPRVSPDHWIYFPEANVRVGRVHEPRNWSPAMSPEGFTSLVVEFFCAEGDSLWREADDALAMVAAEELERLGLIRRENVIGQSVVRLCKAYPVYTIGYREALNELRCYLSRFSNLFCIGRNGMFRYTSGDRYMEMGLRAAENAMGAKHNLTSIAAEEEYAES